MKIHTKRFIPFAKPEIGIAEKRAVIRCLNSNWITTGTKAEEFENTFAETVGAKYAISVSSCTAALHLSLIANGISEGDEVIVSPLTFVSTINAIEYCKAKPIFVDISPNCYTIDSYKIEAAITKQTKAIIAVHYGGNPCHLEKINQIAQKYKLKVIEDAAHALGTYYQKKMIGNSDNLVCFSFYATKNITTGEGGMIVTNNEKYIDLLRELRLHGLSKDAWNRYGRNGEWSYDVKTVGYKYNMPDILAVIGIEQLKKLKMFNAKRKRIVERYQKRLQSSIELLHLPQNNEASICSYFLYPIILSKSENRDGLVKYLQMNGIQTSVLFIPVYRFSYYIQKYHFDIANFPETERVFQGLVCLPLYPSLSLRKVDTICKCIKKFLKEGERC